MWPAFLIALMLGFLLGYSLTRIFLSRRNNTGELEQKLDDAQTELDKARNTQRLLEQENADLKYQLGEEKRARSYYQDKYQGQEKHGGSEE